MRIHFGFFIVAACLLVTFGPVRGFAGQSAYPATDEALAAAFDALDWEVEATRYQLRGSQSELSLPRGLVLLRGESAERYEFLINGTEFPDTEAVVIDDDGGQRTVFEYIAAGYVPDEDWTDVNPDRLLAEIREATDDGNQERAENGFPPLRIVGWIQRPTYDQTEHTVHWILELSEGETSFANWVALRLNRHGYHRVIWVGPMENATTPQYVRDTVIASHSYNQGARYADFVSGDKLAGFGLASLVAVSAGSKQGRGLIAGIIAAALVFLKKGWFVILAVLAGGWVAFKRLFAGRADRRGY